MKLIGKRAFISGAARGIGLAMAQAMADDGASVVLGDIDIDSATTNAAAIAGKGVKALAIAMDVTQSQSVRAAIDQAAAELGGLDILISNTATRTPNANLVDLDEEDWQRAMDVNVTSAFFVCKYGIPHLRTAGGGSIILTASQMGRVANPGSTTYCTTKGALIQLAKGIALDHAKENIRCNTLSPGGTATERMEWRYGDLDTAEKEWGPTHPLGRLGRPEEMGRGAVFLASEESSFMTGADLLLDGGYAAR